MRVDAHHHLWRYEPDAFDWIAPGSVIARDFLAEDLATELAAAEIDAAIAVQARQIPEETHFLLACARALPAIRGVIGWIDLRAPDIDHLLDAVADARLVGFRHVVQDEADPDFLLGEAFVRGVRKVVDRGLSYDLLVNPAQLATIPAFLDRIGKGRFILDHAAKPTIASGIWQPWATAIAAVAAYRQVDCKVSGLVTEADHARWTPADIERYLGHVLEVFGPERLIWGSDWPVCRLAAEYSAVVDLVANFVSRHCPEKADAIFGDNAVRAYRLDEVPT